MRRQLRLFVSGRTLVVMLALLVGVMLFLSLQRKLDTLIATTNTLRDQNCVTAHRRRETGHLPDPKRLESMAVKQHAAQLPVSGLKSVVTEKIDQPPAPSATIEDVPDKFRPQWWHSHIQRTCRDLGYNTDISKLKPHMLEKVLVDDKHRILFCHMAKVGSTNLDKIFATMAGLISSTNPRDIADEDVHYKYNKLEVHFSSFPMKEVVDRVNTFYKFIFVRDPFERFLSGFRDKFEHKRPGYFTKLSQLIREQYRKAASNGSDGITFTEFVAYLADPQRKVHDDLHWKSFFELCRPCEMQYDFIGSLPNLEEDMTHVLKVNNLSYAVRLPKRTSIHSLHETDTYLRKYYSQVPKELLVELYKKVYRDYAIFNLTLPGAIASLLTDM